MFRLITVLCGISLAFASSPEENVGDSSLFEGDVKLLPEQQFAIDHHLDLAASTSAFGASKRSRRWTDKTVLYTLHESLESSSSAKRVITSAMEEWSQKTCIKFKKRTNEAYYIEFFKGSGCWSNVGMIGRKQQISLAGGCWNHGIVIHEIGHALGFWHEQSRPDRDNYVTIMWENIRENTKSNFNKYSDSSIDSLGVPYDYGSIMHYGRWAFTINGKETIVPKNGASIGQRRHLSEKDAKQMNLMYKCDQVISAALNCDDRMTLYADGVKVGNDNGKWDKSTAYVMPVTTKVVAIEGMNSGGPGGIAGSFSSGLVTDEISWRCYNTLVPNWNSPGFDDSSWPRAVVVSHPREPSKLSGPKISQGAKWIWTNNVAKDMRVYCRAPLVISAALNCDDKMTLYADGVKVGNDNGKWDRSTAYVMPVTTKVVAIEGMNSGGPGGIVGSFSTGLVTDGTSWRCHNTLVPNWNSPGFDDSSWSRAVIVSHPREPSKLHGPKISQGAKWIWTGNAGKDMRVYCRAQLV